MEQQPLIPANTTTTEAAPPVSRGLIFLSIIGILSIWANHEASKGFDVAVFNDAGDTPQSRLFSLLFLSNDEATRIVLRTSSVAHRLLTTKKLVRRITLRLVAGRNPTQVLHRHHDNSSGDYVIQVSESLMILDERGAHDDIKCRMVREIERGVARVWLWDGNGGAPSGLVAGMADVVGGVAGDGGAYGGIGCWRGGAGEWDWEGAGDFLRYCEELKSGFIGRLNEAMRDGWSDRMVDDALGVPAQHMCKSYYESPLRFPNVGLVDDYGTHVS